MFPKWSKCQKNVMGGIHDWGVTSAGGWYNKYDKMFHIRRARWCEKSSVDYISFAPFLKSI